jgi:serine O-acetyltransferase
MTKPAEKIASLDPVWASLRREAEEMAAAEPALASLIHASILHHERLEDALSYILSHKLGSNDVPAMMLRDQIAAAFAGQSDIAEAVRADAMAVRERDPACRTLVQPFLFFKGFLALQGHRAAHRLWAQGRTGMALYLQSRVSEVFAVDIHPAVKVGKGVFIDHATGIVIGETAVIEDDVSMLQGVTLGGTGKERGDRHPKIRRGVLIGAHAMVIGNIEVGEYSRVGAGSVVLEPVAPHCTVAGVPARPKGCAGADLPAQSMNQNYLASITSDFDI